MPSIIMTLVHIIPPAIIIATFLNTGRSGAVFMSFIVGGLLLVVGAAVIEDSYFSDKNLGLFQGPEIGISATITEQAPEHVPEAKREEQKSQVQNLIPNGTDLLTTNDLLET